jgi:hypothetical protein
VQLGMSAILPDKQCGLGFRYTQPWRCEASLPTRIRVINYLDSEFTSHQLSLLNYFSGAIKETSAGLRSNSLLFTSRTEKDNQQRPWLPRWTTVLSGISPSFVAYGRLRKSGCDWVGAPAYSTISRKSRRACAGAPTSACAAFTSQRKRVQ